MTMYNRDKWYIRPVFTSIRMETLSDEANKTFLLRIKNLVSRDNGQFFQGSRSFVILTLFNRS